jgi:hypothetical protein
MRNGKKPHSLGSINSTQHSSTKEGGKRKKNRGEEDFFGWERALLKLKRGKGEKGGSLKQGREFKRRGIGSVEGEEA